MPALKVEGLEACKENFEKLSADVQGQIGRDALREAGWTLGRVMRAQTYTTFNKQSGAIRSGIVVHVQRQAQDNSLTAFVEERAQPLAGDLSPIKQTLRAHMTKKGSRSRKPIPLFGIAFWWRFMEYGTKPRRAGRTPGFLRAGKVARTGSQERSQARWMKTSNRGAIESRSWLRPVFAGGAQQAVDAFSNTFKRLLNDAVEKYPK